MANKDGRTSVKMNTDIVEEVRKSKKKHSLSISKFFELAGKEALKKLNKK